MLYEHSYGALLYFIHEWVKYFILIWAIRQQKTSEPFLLSSFAPFIEYGFPKWHPEPEDNGSILANVIREIQEETGIGSDQLFLEDFDEKNPAFSLSYDTTNKHGQAICKTSTYYALEMNSIDPLTILEVPSDFVDEISDIRIVSEDKVTSVLTHDNEKQLFEGWISSRL